MSQLFSTKHNIIFGRVGYTLSIIRMVLMPKSTLNETVVVQSIITWYCPEAYTSNYPSLGKINQRISWVSPISGCFSSIYGKKGYLSLGQCRTGRLRGVHGNPTDQHHPGGEDLSQTRLTAAGVGAYACAGPLLPYALRWANTP